MAKKNFWENVKDFFHNVKTKISLSFKGKKAVVTFEIDLTAEIRPQIRHIEDTVIANLPNKFEIAKYVQSVKEETEA